MPVTPFKSRKMAIPLFILGALMICLGLSMTVAPERLNVSIPQFMAWMLVAGGSLLFFWNHTLAHRTGMSWMKCLSPMAMGIFLLTKPFALVIVLGMAIFIYFILDAAATITLAMDWKGIGGWRLFFVNGLVSLLLAGGFILLWPYDTYMHVGLMLSLSLMLDGISLIMFSLSIH